MKRFIKTESTSKILEDPEDFKLDVNSKLIKGHKTPYLNSDSNKFLGNIHKTDICDGIFSKRGVSEFSFPLSSSFKVRENHKTASGRKSESYMCSCTSDKF